MSEVDPRCTCLVQWPPSGYGTPYFTSWCPIHGVDRDLSAERSSPEFRAQIDKILGWVDQSLPPAKEDNLGE